MARETSAMIYYRKVFGNARRCLQEAVAQSHPSSKSITVLKNPKTGEGEDVMSLDLAAEWCMDHHLPAWSQGTWRMHRCGYRMLLQKLASTGRLPSARVSEIVQKMESVSGLKKNERVKKSSSRRKKVVLPEHIEQIEVLVTEKQSKWGAALVIWLKAATIAGLRPNEWQTATIEMRDDRTILRSENFKHNESRSYSTHREIDLTDLPPEQILCVRQQLSIVHGMVEKKLMEEYYSGCASLLYWCNKKLWPKRKANVQLYTGRHQFSANAKADPLVTDKERAALMGHKTTQTSTERYGRARSGSAGLTPKVADPSVLGNIIDKPNVRPQAPKAKPA